MKHKFMVFLLSMFFIRNCQIDSRTTTTPCIRTKDIFYVLFYWKPTEQKKREKNLLLFRAIECAIECFISWNVKTSKNQQAPKIERKKTTKKRERNQWKPSEFDSTVIWLKFSRHLANQHNYIHLLISVYKLQLYRLFRTFTLWETKHRMKSRQHKTTENVFANK